MAYSLHSEIRTSGHHKTRRRGLLGRVLNIVALLRSRQALSRLDDQMLDDIGVTPKQARREASRPLWDVPANWID